MVASPSNAPTGTNTTTAAAPLTGSTSSGSGSAGHNTNTSTGTASGQGSAQTYSIPGNAQIDPEVPSTAKEAPLMGVEASANTSFVDQVKGHAKYFAGKTFGNDKEVQLGAAK